MRDVTRQIATAFRYKNTVINKPWLQVAALSWSCQILSVALQLTQLTQLTNVSKYLCSIFGWSLLLRRSKNGEFLHKTAISLKNCRVEQKNHSFLANWPDWALSSQHLLRVEADLSVHLTLGPLRLVVGLRSPSNSFILSSRLTITLHLYLLLFRTQLQKAFSANAGALWLWHSPPQ